MTTRMLMTRHMPKRLLAAALSAALLLPAPASIAAAAEAVTMGGVEVSADEVKVRLSGEAQYNAFITAAPPRLVLQLIDTEHQGSTKTMAGKGKYLKSVRSGQYERSPSPITRVVLDLAEVVAYSVSQGGDAITVHLGADVSEASGTPAPVAETPAPEPAAAAAAPAPAPRPKVAISSKTSAKVGEAGGMTTEVSPDLAAMAAGRDENKTQDMAGEGAQSASPRLRVARGDIMSRLPRDKISLDFDNTDIRDVLKLLSAKAKVNVIYGPDVSGSLSLHLTDVPFHEAFRTTLSMTGLTTVQVGENILRVLSPSALAKTQTTAALATKVIPLNYSKAGDITSSINTVRAAEGRAGSAIADLKTNSVIVTESLEGLAATERLIAQLDLRPKQVLIEAKLVEVGLNNSLHYGIQWDYLGIDGAKIGGQQGTNLIGTAANPNGAALLKPLDRNSSAAVGVGASGRGTGVQLPATSVFGALTLGRITNNYFLSATLTAAAAQGKVKVLSDPKVATLNNQPATINVTTSIPYTTSNVASTGVTTQAVEYVVTGIQLSVTPTINADGRITLDINPKVSQPSATVAASITGAPGIDERNAKTTILVKDGETVVIGGLISDSVSNQVAKIPLLGDIPILGWLFKKKSIVRTRSELLIFVTPKIMAD